MAPHARVPRPWAVLGAAMALYATAELYLTRGTTVFVDEVALFETNGGLHPSALIAPVNEHLILARRLMYAVTLPLLGARGSFVAAKFVEIACVMALMTVVFVWLQPRLGPVAALAPTVLIAFFGSAWEISFSISGIDNVVAVASGASALLALERRSRHGDLAACGLLVIAVTSFTTGIAFAIGAGCIVAARHEWRRAWWVAAVPLAVYASWLLWVRLVYVPEHGEVQHLAAFNVLLIPNLVADHAASTAGALAGLNYDLSPTSLFASFLTSSEFAAPLAVAATAALVWRLRQGGTSPLAWGLIATLLAYWVELALGFGTGRTPNTVRYVYPSGTLVVLMAATVAPRPLVSRRALIVVFALCAAALLGNLARLRDGMHLYRTLGGTIRAELTGIELAAPNVSPSFHTTVGGLAPVTAGPYLNAVRRYGSPAYSARQLVRLGAAARAAADAETLSALGVHLAPGTSGTGCRRLAPSASGPSFHADSSDISLAASGTAPVSLSRFGDPPGAEVGELAAGRRFDLRIPRGSSPRPWRVTVGRRAGAVTVCPVG